MLFHQVYNFIDLCWNCYWYVQPVEFTCSHNSIQAQYSKLNTGCSVILDQYDVISLHLSIIYHHLLIHIRHHNLFRITYWKWNSWLRKLAPQRGWSGRGAAFTGCPLSVQPWTTSGMHNSHWACYSPIAFSVLTFMTLSLKCRSCPDFLYNWNSNVYNNG